MFLKNLIPTFESHNHFFIDAISKISLMTGVNNLITKAKVARDNGNAE